MSITLHELQSPFSHTTKINLCQALLLLTHRKQHTVHAVKGWGWSPHVESDPGHPLKLQAEEWNESVAWLWWRRWRAPSWPDPLQDKSFDLSDKKKKEECAGEANRQETDDWWEIMPQLTNLQRKAWRRLAWQTFHLCPGSGQDERCLASPTHSHHTGQMSGEDTLWSPGGMQAFKGFIIISATFCSRLVCRNKSPG